jgi:hypothetical protein
MNKHLILSVGMPRAGSGWYYNLTQDLVIASGGEDARTIRSRYKLGRFLTEVNCNLGTLSSYRLLPTMLPILFENSYVIKLHAERRPVADQFIRAGIIKPTYIYRDPRDALLSAYEYGQRMSSQGLTNAFSHLKTIDDAIDFMDFYVKLSAGWLASPQTLKVRYEDLKGDYDREVERLCVFLGIDPSSEIALRVSEQYRPGKPAQKQQGLHFVKGKIGRHQQAFSADQLDRCHRLFGDFLKAQGYE